ncbi:nuclease-related domain-containing protein [Endozoicomonas sp. ONNA2]|uniref:nuclease-related domain-containing protein n=1 Tax=Endozoicomonas sp. ONNA2 TaxID=2828741 RepID=UPI002147714B|nr:NERD domain-containing protein [Endozoicomonas sp. ONNA2]
MKGLLKFGLFGFLLVLFVNVIATGSPSFMALYLYFIVFMLLFLFVATIKATASFFRSFFSLMDKKIAPDKIDQNKSSQPDYDAGDDHQKHDDYRQNGETQKRKNYTETYRDEKQAPAETTNKHDGSKSDYYYDRLNCPIYQGVDKRSSPAPQSTVDSEFEEIKASFNDHKDAGDFGEAKVRAVLSKLKGKVIYGFIGSQNIFYAGKNFEIDFVISVPGVGFIMAEVKYHSGQIFCDNKPMWRQIKTNGSTYDYKNASKQIIRTRGLFKRLLTDHDINKWPIKMVVIYAHENAVIYPAMSPDNPQTDVVKLENLESWIKKLPRNDQISMTREEHKQIEALIERHHRKYEAA